MTPALRRSILRGLGLTGILIIGYMLAVWTRPEPVPEYHNVIVTKHDIEKGRPDTIIKFRDHILTRIVKPEVIAVAPHAADSTVKTFCAATVASLTPQDTAKDSTAAIPMLFDAGTFDGRHLKLWEARANGDAAAESFAVHAPFSFAVKDGHALVRGSRTWWIRGAIKVGAAFGTGYMIGHGLR